MINNRSCYMNTYSLCVAVVSLAVLSGCAGQRDSYRSLVSGEPPAISLSVGDKKEVLVISNGFPGWWGYYPAIKSLNTSVASVDCSSARSAVPFRKPGMLLGGERCYLTAHSEGETWLRTGNKFGLSNMDSEPTASDDQWVRLKVLPE